jgi:predicted DNA-binding protein (MmcQ/YjbR family)
MVELKERNQAIGEPINGDKRYWVSVQLGQDVPDDEVRALVSKSYHLVAEKYR